MVNNEGYLDLDMVLRQVITPQMAHFFKIIPASSKEDKYQFYISDEESSKISSIHNELNLLLNRETSFIPVEHTVLMKSLSVHYRVSKDVKAKRHQSGDNLDKLISNARDLGASDIHVEIYNDSARVRFRIDGLLVENQYIELENYSELINQVKIKANLDITERRLPQDGRIEYGDFDVRVSVLPVHYGEKVVMRILGRDASNLDIKNIGFSKSDLQLYLNAARRSSGIILVSGPTGSGKTTTLYATLKFLNDKKRNIVTVEDPIEYTLKGVNQVQLKESIGLNFASALKSFLRQDPDIIMLGEIRDSETAQMAVRASLTGHLVLSTIHTNSSFGTISRLADLGVPRFLIAETLNVSVAQRLVRKLCKNCKEPRPFSPEILPKNLQYDEEINQHFIAVGCEECFYSGYQGRTAIFELLRMDAFLIAAIKNNESFAAPDKVESLGQQAFKLFTRGETSLDEIYSILINS